MRIKINMDVYKLNEANKLKKLLCSSVIAVVGVDA